MSSEQINTDSSPAPGTVSATTATIFTLTTVNASSVAGPSCFSVFPPILKNLPAISQVLMALVSAPTVQGGAPGVMTWKGGSGALTLFALVSGAAPENNPGTPVALADTVAIDWINGAFSLVPSAGGGPVDGIEVTFTAAVPIGTQIGLTVGPGAILVQQPAGQAPLTLTPDLSLVATVVFGTAFQMPMPDMSDVSKPQTVTFTPGGTIDNPTASAAIFVGLDNLIVETG